MDFELSISIIEIFLVIIVFGDVFYLRSVKCFCSLSLSIRMSEKIADRMPFGPRPPIPPIRPIPPVRPYSTEMGEKMKGAGARSEK